MSSNQSFLVEKSGKKILLVFTILVITFIFSDLSLGKGKLDDYFHHGEYFNVLPSILLNFGKQPYMSLHGALDYLPAWLAYELVGDQFYVHLTHIFYISLKLILFFEFCKYSYIYSSFDEIYVYQFIFKLSNLKISNY
jgi:hypothetical protein